MNTTKPIQYDYITPFKTTQRTGQWVKPPAAPNPAKPMIFKEVLAAYYDEIKKTVLSYFNSNEFAIAVKRNWTIYNALTLIYTAGCGREHSLKEKALTLNHCLNGQLSSETINYPICHCLIQERIKKIKRKTHCLLISRRLWLPKAAEKQIPKHRTMQGSM